MHTRIATEDPSPVRALPRPRAAFVTGLRATQGWIARLRRRLIAPVDIAWLVALRVLYALLVGCGALRLLILGAQSDSRYANWIDAFFGAGRFHFKYFGFHWVPAPSGAGVYTLLCVLVGLSIASAIGLCYRASALGLALALLWFELSDATFYVNHYYLLTLLGLLLAVSPAGSHASFDAWWRSRRGGGAPAGRVAAGWLFLFRFQIGVVYTFAGLAKAHADWLVHAQPLRIWLAAKTDVPVLGPMLLRPWAAPLLSWSGFVFDVAIPWLLLRRILRPYAYGALIGFHVLTYVLFPRITWFPAIMITCSLVFFEPDWPRRVRVALRCSAPDSKGICPPRVEPHREPVARARTDRALWLMAGYCALQVLIPLRSALYGGDVRWHEQGLRFSWRVLHREKLGVVSFTVRAAKSGAVWEIDPALYLNPIQATEMAEQPDLIVQLAHHIRDDFARRGLGEVEVRARALCTLNGRPSALLVDPEVDLARVTDSLWPARFILPVPAAPPPHNHATR